MNKYTLQLKNKKIRQQYEAEDLQVLKIHIRNIAVVLTITVVAQIIILIINATKSYKIFLYFSLYLIGILITYFVSKFFLHMLRIFHSFNVLLFASLILWSFVDSDLKQEIEEEKSLTPFVRGIFLCIQFFVLNVSSYFPFQALMYTYLITLLLSAVSQNPLVDAIKLIPMLVALIQKCYYEDKGKKRRFLLQKKDDIWDHLTNELLPTSLIVVKWDKEANRIEFYSQNKQAEKVFKIQNTADFNEFSRIFVLEELNDKMERNRPFTLTKSQIKWEDTLLVQIKNKIHREKFIFDNCDEPQLLSQKDLSEDNFFRKFAQTISPDNLYKKSVSNATLTNRKGLSPKSKTMTNTADLQNTRIEKQFLGKIDYFLGEHRHDNFDITGEDDRYSVRLGAYFLNEWFGVISIEEQSFRDKYVQQKIQYNSLCKQINQNYDYLLNCSRQNIENIRELYQKLFSSIGVAQQKGQLRFKNLGHIQQEINSLNYFCDRSSASETQNSFNEPIKECSSFLENKSPINTKQRQNFHLNLSLPHKNIGHKDESDQGEQVFKIKQLHKHQHSYSPPPTFGSDLFNPKNNKMNKSISDQNNFQSNYIELNNESSPKNQNIFTKKNHKKSSLQFLTDNQKSIKSNFVSFNDFNAGLNNNEDESNNININSANNNANSAQIFQQTNFKNIEPQNDICMTPKSQKQISSAHLKDLPEGTKSMYTAIMMKVFLLNKMLKANKKNNLYTEEAVQIKNVKKVSLKKVVSNLTGLFRYTLGDKGSSISIHYDENLQSSINQDQNKLTQLLFSSLNLMALNTQPSYEMQVHVFSNTCPLEEDNLLNQESEAVTENNKIADKNEEAQKQESKTNKENSKDKVFKFKIKSRLIDAVTSRVPHIKDLSIRILDQGYEQIFTKSAISACEKIIKEIGPYSTIKFEFDPNDCSFQMTYSIYQDLGVLIKHQHLNKTNKKNNNNNTKMTHQTNINQNQQANNLSRRSTQNGALRERMESNLFKSYNIMNLSEENFLKAKDLNFNQIISKQVNCRTIQVLETFIPVNQQQTAFNQVKTQNNFIRSPLNQIEYNSTNQRIFFSSNNTEDKQFQKMFKKRTPSFSQSIIDGNTQQPIAEPKEKQQDLNSSQEISQNQQRSLINQNSVSNIIQQQTNLTLD